MRPLHHFEGYKLFNKDQLYILLIDFSINILYI